MAYSASDAADWILARAKREGEFLTQMKLQKLVYIGHGWHLALRDEPLFFDLVEAWKWGPVIRSLYARFLQYGGSPIQSQYEDGGGPELGTSAPLLKRVWDVYKRNTAAQLSEMTHRKGTPWEQVYQPNVKVVIPNDIIAKHYKELAKHRSG